MALSKKDLEKPFHNNEHGGKYQDRGEYLLYIINQGKEIDLMNSSKVTVDKENSTDFIKFLETKDYDKLKSFKGTDGNTYSLSKIKKTSDFGGGSGVGGGSAQTEIQESSQCAVNALCYKLNRLINVSDLNEHNIKSVSSNIDTTSSIDSILDFCLNNHGWQESLVNSANIFYSKYKSNKFRFHRGSKLVSNIYKAFSIAKKNSKVSLNNDKWNPADIWAVNISFGSKNFPTELEALNNLIKELNLNNELIGISLKKTGKDANLDVINDGNSKSKKYEISEITSTSKSANAIIKFGKDLRITFRTANFATNFVGEIEGKNARHGKIGQGSLNNALVKFGEESLEPSKTISQDWKNRNEERFKEFYTYYNDIVESISYNDFVKKINDNNINWFVSKFMSLKTIFIIKNSPNQNNIIEYIMNFASSSTSDSSMFIKISESQGGVSLKPLVKYLKTPPKISNLMKEHIKSGKSLVDSNFKKGSSQYLQLFKEARELYSKGIVNILNPHDLNLIKNTKIGEIVEHNGSKIPLDFPLTENFKHYIYNMNPVDKSISKILINESYDDRLFQVEMRIILDKNERDINDTLSDVRAIEGVTIVHIADVDDLWSVETQHNIKVKIKIDPAPFKAVNKAIFNNILNKVKKMPGVLKATYVSKIKVI